MRLKGLDVLMNKLLNEFWIFVLANYLLVQKPALL